MFIASDSKKHGRGKWKKSESGKRDWEWEEKLIRENGNVNSLDGGGDDRRGSLALIAKLTAGSLSNFLL